MLNDVIESAKKLKAHKLTIEGFMNDDIFKVSKVFFELDQKQEKLKVEVPLSKEEKKEELKEEDIKNLVKGPSYFDQLSDEEILLWSTGGYDEIQEKKKKHEQDLKLKESEEKI